MGASHRTLSNRRVGKLVDDEEEEEEEVEEVVVEEDVFLLPPESVFCFLAGLALFPEEEVDVDVDVDPVALPFRGVLPLLRRFAVIVETTTTTNDECQ